ncbi:MAG: bifunctional riboflavin kinase/FAD synthetase [Bdellovibrionales bacterium]
MKGGSFALGNFDGIHRGHRAVIEACCEKARKIGIPSRVLTFEPHPRSFFQPGSPTFRLTPPNVKMRILKSLGIDDVITLPFDSKLAQMPAEEFVERILIKEFGIQHLVAGHDFIFGHNRGGDMKKLSDWLAPHNVGVTEIGEMGEDGDSFSSTRVRELLLEGQVEAASKILGRDWSIEGTVVRGSARGEKELGFPTANINLGMYLCPKRGVYVVRAGKAGEELPHRGVANIGHRPTVDGKEDNLEAFLFSFDNNIYGQNWEFALTRYIRPEKKFDTLEALKNQIAKDVEAAKEA